jgi:hypothetical protein
MINRKIRTFILIVFALFSSPSYSQKIRFTVGEKVTFNGSHLVLIEFNDSVVYENNKFVYCLKTPKDSSLGPDKNVYFQNKFGFKKPIKVNGSVESLIDLDKFLFYGLHSNNILRYLGYAYSKNNLDTTFKNDMKLAFENISRDTFDFFLSPEFYYFDGFEYGLYCININIYVEGYLVHYENFEDYEFEFLHSSLDNRTRKLVGTRKYPSRLFHFKQLNPCGFTVFIPTKTIVKDY